jgi:hypothetical protein
MAPGPGAFHVDTRRDRSRLDGKGHVEDHGYRRVPGEREQV